MINPQDARELLQSLPNPGLQLENSFGVLESSHGTQLRFHSLTNGAAVGILSG